MAHAEFLQPVVLQISLDSIHLGHAVGDRRAGGKHSAAIAGQFVKIPALGKHIAGLLRICGGKPGHIPHFGIEKKVLKIVRFVDEHAVAAELLKGHNIVFPSICLQLFQPCFQPFAGALQLLHGEAFAAAALHFVYAVCDLVDLLLKEPFLTLRADGNFLKLRVADDDGIVVAGSDAGAELLSVAGFKIFFGGNKEICGGVEPQELRCPLLCQMVRHHENAFLRQTEAFGFHAGRHHFKSLARANFVCQQCITTVKHMSDGVFLMVAELDFRVHTGKRDMASVVFAGACAIHFLVILPHQCLTAFRVLPNPIFESIPDCLLLLGGEGGFFGVENAPFLAVRVLHGVVNADIAQIQRIFEDAVGICPVGTVGDGGRHIAVTDIALAADVPLGCIGGVVYLNVSAKIKGRVEGFLHELLDILLVGPRSAKTDFNFRGVQILGLRPFQRLHIDLVCRVLIGSTFGLPQLLPHIARQIFVAGLPVVAYGVMENHAGEIGYNFILIFAGELCHIRQINSGMFRDGNGKRFAGSIYCGNGGMLLDGALGEHIRLAFQPAVIVQHFQRTQKVVGRIVRKGKPVGTVIDKTIFCGELVVKPVELVLLPDDGKRVALIHLKVD